MLHDNNSLEQRIEVPVDATPYSIIVGNNLLDRLSELIHLPEYTAKIALVSSQPILDLYGDRVLAELGKLPVTTNTIVVPDGEEAKSLDTLQHCYDEFGQMILGRRDLVVALGGGVIGDLVGFAAATWNRGVNIVQIATTLVAQVDSAIGGKTGVNLPTGKNLVGAFHQPLIVINDTSTLRTLPVREIRAGLAEVVKYGFIADVGILDLLNAVSAKDAVTDLNLLTELVQRSAAVKARVVGDDELESGGREILNYGHTVGHVIETLSEYREFRHGEAVAIGMVFAARLGEKLGVSDEGLTDQTIRLLAKLGLPTGGVELDRDMTWEVMARDKKARAGVRFVLCPRPGSVAIVDPPDRTIVNEVLDTLA
ncbi:MAG: 3-dehydroquinate synthase [Pseudonocardia sp.]